MEQCQAVQIIRDGSLDLRINAAKKSLEYVHADMGGDIRVDVADGVVSLDERRDETHGMFAWRSCW
jgi:hypothetical protein